jgi:hypothetical protein
MAQPLGGLAKRHLAIHWRKIPMESFEGAFNLLVLRRSSQKSIGRSQGSRAPLVQIEIGPIERVVKAAGLGLVVQYLP